MAEARSVSWELQTLSLDDAGTQLAYLDSGEPLGLSTYVTIFAIHGLAFSAPIFHRVASIAAASQLRLVAINRRDYPLSSPVSGGDITKLLEGSDEDKRLYLKDRGLEILKFISLFIQQNHLPPISDDGATGGVALLGWSLGNSFALAAIANSLSLDDGAKARLASHLRSLILQDPPAVSLGMPLPPRMWFLTINEAIPAEMRLQFSLQWLTSYFQHGDLNKRDLDILSYILPSTARAPTIFSIHRHISDIVILPPVLGSDGLLMGKLAPQLFANYRKTCFDPEIRNVFPKMKIWELTHELTTAVGIAAYWKIQDDDAANGGGKVNFAVIPGTNHFMHWDDPTIAIEAYKRAVA